MNIEENSVVIHFLQAKVPESLTETNINKCNTMHNIKHGKPPINNINKESKMTM